MAITDNATIRLLSLWSLSLPFGLYSMTAEWTLPISVLLSYVVLSLEDIGVEIEEPFHILPIRQYTEGKFSEAMFVLLDFSDEEE